MESSQLEVAAAPSWSGSHTPFKMQEQIAVGSEGAPKYEPSSNHMPMMDFSQMLQAPDLFPGSMTDMLNGIDMHGLTTHKETHPPISHFMTPTSPINTTLPNNNPVHEAVKKLSPKKQKMSTVNTDVDEDSDEVPRRKRRRPSTTKLNGLTEEEALQRLLPDHLHPNLDMVIIGINPGLSSACVGHHYAGPANHFWKCMYLSGLIPEPLTAFDDYKLLNMGIGFTNIVPRTTRTSTDLTRKEIKEGSRILQSKMERFKPKIAVFNGIGIYELFIGRKDFHVGKQPHSFPGVEETAIFVMPSSSARFTQLPRAVDKLPFYLALKKLRDYYNGRIPAPAESEVSFPEANFRIIPKSQRPGYDAEEAAKQEKKALMKKKRVRRFKRDEDEDGEQYMANSNEASVSSENKESQGEISPMGVTLDHGDLQHNTTTSLPPIPTPVPPLPIPVPTQPPAIKTEVESDLKDSITEALLQFNVDPPTSKPNEEGEKSNQILNLDAQQSSTTKPEVVGSFPNNGATQQLTSMFPSNPQLNTNATSSQGFWQGNFAAPHFTGHHNNGNMMQGLSNGNMGFNPSQPMPGNYGNMGFPAGIPNNPAGNNAPNMGFPHGHHMSPPPVNGGFPFHPMQQYYGGNQSFPPSSHQPQGVAGNAYSSPPYMQQHGLDPLTSRLASPPNMRNHLYNLPQQPNPGPSPPHMNPAPVGGNNLNTSPSSTANLTLGGKLNASVTAPNPNSVQSSPSVSVVSGGGGATNQTFSSNAWPPLDPVASGFNFLSEPSANTAAQRHPYWDGVQ